MPFRTLTLAAALAALPVASKRLTTAMLQRNLAKMREGDPGPMLRFYAKDVRFRFPGHSSWAADLQGKDEVARWIGQFLDAGLQLQADEIVISGPPWNTTFALRCTDHARGPDGELVYENRAVLWGRMAWGLVREYEVYEDTEKSLAFDEYLNGARSPAAVPTRSP